MSTQAVDTAFRASSIEKALPTVDYATVTERHVDAAPERAFGAALAVTFGELRLSSALLVLRMLPRVITTRRLPRLGLSRPFLEALVSEPGFLLLAEPRDCRAAVGYVGRPWQPAAVSRRLDSPEAFVAFDEPGWAKVVMDIDARPDPRGGAILRTETQIHLTSDDARRAFGRYWRLVRIGSVAIRKDWLRAAARRARLGDLTER